MKRPSWSSTVAAASAALVLSAAARRLRRQAAPNGSSNAFRGHPLIAATYDWGTRLTEPELMNQLRDSILGQATGRVLEIGIGTGLSLPYYRQAASILGVEPDPFMLRKAEQRAQRMGLDVELHQARAEALPFPDASFDTVTAILVFCSVDDPSEALAEVRRVLKPEGAFRFVEHVRAEGGFAARAQDLITPVYRRISANCHANRRTAESIRAAGFEFVEMREEQPDPFSPVIAGVARPR